MQLIVRLLQLARAEPRFSIRIHNPPYLPLVIEDTCRNGPRGFPCISVAQYIQDSPVRCKPEMLFEVRSNKYFLRLSPIYYRNDTTEDELWSVVWDGRVHIVDSDALARQERFSQEWNRRLEQQGYERAYIEKTSSHRQTPNPSVHVRHQPGL